MKTNHFAKAGILMLLIVAAFIFCWEVYWRSRDFTVSYDDGKVLWADHRAKVYEEKATVFIEASRIKFDLDIPTWETLTGEKAVQLSMVGSNPRPLLHDLANDPNFKGRLVIDVTEPLFFSVNPGREKSPKEAIAFYKTYSPSQKFSTIINNVLESQLVFLDQEKFSTNALLKDLELKNRDGVRERAVFPKEFASNYKSRQAYMTEPFLKDTALINRQIEAWKKSDALMRNPGVSGDSLQQIFIQVKTSIDKIRARGGDVIFVRTPSSGGYIETENFVYPREKYWDQMLAFTNSNGIHFTDYPVTAKMICPEWSHLSTKDAILYTKVFIDQLKEKNFFNYSTSPLALNKNN
ncbi:MAG: hypothetical protein M3413_13740 [Bacteroidota bacterium]|nr:hypothetical protein [Bacteroidota bacterium]